jgi:hypothetical protein
MACGWLSASKGLFCLSASSRVFTEQGGNVEMFSANGDLNAGKGPKSKSAYPPLTLVCDTDGYCRVSPAGLVTGAGIGALVSVAGQDPTLSNVVLSAPHGTVDAGAAGLRSANDLNIVALRVLNAFNIQVGGAATGVPVVQAPPVAALTSANDTAAATQQTVTPNQSGTKQASVMIVEIIGYGGGDDTQVPAQPQNDKQRKDDQSYDPDSSFKLLGNGALTQEQQKDLTDEE